MYRKIIIVLTILLAASTVWAAEYQAGVHYIEIPNPIAIDAKKGQTGEVWVFFKYTCPACYQLHPSLEAWQAQADSGVVIREMPVFQPEIYSKAFYAAEMLKLDNAFHLGIYQSIHQNKKPLRKLEEFAELALAQGVDPDNFLNMANSFTVSTKMKQAVRWAGQAQVPGTPFIVVNGKYLLSGKMVGSNAGMLDVADYLLAQDSLMTME